ncbi:MAG: signal peptide peptidase SppA [Myxococcaceae bacterium]|nr:signal peptide peptidase SppA [Myxococcaceae bacterium]
MKRFIVISLAAIGALTLAFVVFVFGLAILAAGSKPAVPAKVVLELKLDDDLPEIANESPFEALGEKKMTMRDVLDALERAGDDDRVQGLVAYIGRSPGSPAGIEELRDAIKAFRAKGKTAVAWTDSFGESGNGNGVYWLATAFDEISLQPSGGVGLLGFNAEQPFLKDTLDKLGVKPELGARYEYKNAVNMFTEEGFNGPHREATERYLTSIFDAMVKDIAADRKLTEEQVRTLIDGGPVLSEEALKAKLVDRLEYRDEVYDRIKNGFGKGAELLYLDKYLERAGRPHQVGESTIALIYGVGQVQRGKSSEVSPLSGEGAMGSETLSAAFRRASEDPSVKAIVFRIDSPGGSYVASDTIRREVQRAREKGKPVIVSMGNVAASGGYFVAMEADKIVAQPGTITGSIGVFSGKFVTRDLWAKLGVNWDNVQVGKNADIFSTDHEFTPEQRARLDAELDFVYRDFTTKAAAGRKLPLEKLQAVARGRVWTGADAKEIGLVDELGGLPRAMELAKTAGKIGPTEPYRVQVFPKPKTGFEALLYAMGAEREGDNSENEDVSLGTSGVEPLVSDMRAIHEVARLLGIGRARGVVEARLPRVEF